MKQKLNRGFTLIELLVVIAIIGILASVVLASLNTARDKGEDASIKAMLNNSRAQSELFYDDAGRTYLNVCADAKFVEIIAAATAAGGGAAVTECADFADGSVWGMQKQLTDGTFYCVDSTGTAMSAATDTLADLTDATCD